MESSRIYRDMITFEGNSTRFDFKIIDIEKQIGEVHDLYDGIIYRGYLYSTTIDRMDCTSIMSPYYVKVQFRKIIEVKS